MPTGRIRPGLGGVLVATLVAGPLPAAADGLDLTGVGARAVGRAGVSVVSADGHDALYTNPAGMARRGGLRAQAGLSFTDREAEHQTGRRLHEGSPVVRDRAGVDVVPWGGAQLGLGERVVLGAGYLQPTLLSLASATPTIYHRPAPGDDADYPARYAATRLRMDRRGLGAGVAVRALPWLAVGVSAFVMDVRLEERRTLWSGTAEVVDPDGDAGEFPDERPPDHDMELTLHGRDRFVPAAAVGVVVAPEDAPVELAASVWFADDARLRGPVRLDPSRGPVALEDGTRYATALYGDDPRAEVELDMPLVARGGVRFLSTRVALELQATLTSVAWRDPAWQLDDVAVTPGHLRYDEHPLETVAIGTTLRTGFSLGGAVEIDAIPGFLTATAGYAFSRALVPRSSLSTALPDLDAHTLAAGFELRFEGATVFAAAARAEGVAASVAGGPQPAVTVVEPLRDDLPAAGHGANAGRYDGAATLVAVGVELEL